MTVIAVVAFFTGFGLAVLINRTRWSVFPLSGGPPQVFGWMGGPDAIGYVATPATRPIDVPCEHCGAPPGTTCEHDNTDEWRGPKMRGVPRLGQAVEPLPQVERTCRICGARFMGTAAQLPICDKHDVGIGP